MPKVHARETKIEATAIAPLQSVCKLTLAERRSLEEEFEMTTGSLRVGSQSGRDNEFTAVQIARLQCDRMKSVGSRLKSLLVHAPVRPRVYARR